MNCQEALSLLYEIIDKEASEIDTREVQQHLERCKQCFEVYRLESAIQNFINEKLKDGSRTGSLEALKSNVLFKLDEIDGQEAAPESRPFFKRTAALLAAAASLVILIGAAFWARDFYRHQTQYVPLERAHRAVVGHPASIDDDTRTFSTILNVRDKLGYDIYPTVAGFSLAGGQTKEIMGVEMAHFVYCNDNKTISVFVAPCDCFEIPDDLKDTRVEKHHVGFYNYDCRGCRLVYHKTSSAVIITATTDRSVELLDFVPGHAAI